MTHKRIIGTRAEVWHGTAKKTSGGLTKNSLMMNKNGRIVSRAKHSTAKKEMRLVKYGYTAKKGKFGYVKVGSKKHRKGSKKMHGGLNPAPLNSPDMIPNLRPQVFSPLDMALGASTGGRRRKSMGMRGGMVYGSSLAPADVNAGDISGMMPMNGMPMNGMMGSGIDGQGVTNYGMGSTDVQLAAGQAGGKRRRHRKKSMYGGTTSRNYMGQGTAVQQGSPLNQALNAV